MTEKITQFKALLDVSKTIVVIVKTDPSLDQLATASSLFLALSQAGKEVLFLSPSSPSSNHELSGVENISTKMGNQNLVVSFDYSEELVDKVGYHIGEESGKFFLTIKPKKGHPPLDSSKVEFGYTGMEADLAILIGIHDLETLDDLYFGSESFYQDVPLVTIHNFETELGALQFDFSTHLCYAEALVEVLEGLNISFSSEIATNLLYSIEDKTESMTNSLASAKTFETVAKLLRAGARRKKIEAFQKTKDSFNNGIEKVGKIKKNNGSNDLFNGGEKSLKKDAGQLEKNSEINSPKSKIQKMGGLDHKPTGLI